MILLNFLFKLSVFVVTQDVTEEELRAACEKQQAQILQYVFANVLFFFCLHFA